MRIWKWIVGAAPLLVGVIVWAMLAQVNGVFARGAAKKDLRVHMRVLMIIQNLQKR